MTDDVPCMGKFTDDLPTKSERKAARNGCAVHLLIGRLEAPRWKSEPGEKRLKPADRRELASDLRMSVDAVSQYTAPDIEDRLMSEFGIELDRRAIWRHRNNECKCNKRKGARRG